MAFSGLFGRYDCDMVMPVPFSWVDTDAGIISAGEIRHIWTCTPEAL